MPHTVSLADTPSPLFNIVVEKGGTPHSIDPFELLERCVSAAIVDDKGKWAAPNQADLVEKFKECVGLPSLSYTHTLIVIDGFMEYLSSLEKNMPWLQRSSPSTVGTDDSQGTLPGMEDTDPVPIESAVRDVMVSA